MRIIGIICVCLSVVGCGVLCNRRRRRREAFLSGFASYFGALGVTCVSLGGSVDRILRGSAADGDGRFPFPGTLLALYAQTGDLCAAWNGALAQIGAAETLTAEEAALLSSFASAFALPSMAAFTEECNGYAARFSDFAERACEKRRREEKLTVTFTSLLAVLVFILLI